MESSRLSKKRAPLNQVYEYQTSRTSYKPIIISNISMDVRMAKAKKQKNEDMFQGIVKRRLNLFYTNADQFVNKREFICVLQMTNLLETGPLIAVFLLFSLTKIAERRPAISYVTTLNREWRISRRNLLYTNNHIRIC